MSRKEHRPSKKQQADHRTDTEPARATEGPEPVEPGVDDEAAGVSSEAAADQDGTAEKAGASSTGPSGGDGSDAAENLEEVKGRLQRLAADFQNYQRRTQRQLEQSSQFVEEGVLREFLPVLDDFERVLTQSAEAENVAAVLQGVQIVYDHFVKTMTERGLSAIAAEAGQPFDPEVHEAMMRQPTNDQPANTVTQELAKGYKLKDRVLRPARVAVAAPAEGGDAAAEG